MWHAHHKGAHRLVPGGLFAACAFVLVPRTAWILACPLVQRSGKTY